MLVEVASKAYLASLVPVIVNAILNEHQVVVDIVAFVNKGDFPRSRLNEKQRGKILAGWVSRKLRTIAQFAIKDTDRGETLRQQTGTSVAEPSPPQGADHRDSVGSRSSGGPLAAATHFANNSSSLRNVSSPPPPQILEQHTLEPQEYYPPQGYDGSRTTPPAHVAPPTPGPIEMPADELEAPAEPPHGTPGAAAASAAPSLTHGFELPDFDRFGRDESSSAPPGIGGATMSSQQQMQMPPQIRLPGVDGRESFDDWDLEVRRPGSGGRGDGGGGNGGGEQGDEWGRDAVMSMNLAGK